MKVTFWGVRGSFPAAAPRFRRYGGNTPCVEIDTGRNAILIDAGTGIRAAGRSLVERNIADITLLISHTHWDHIQGLPHFAPLYREGTNVHIYGIRHPDRSLSDILRAQQSAPFFPVSLDEMPARMIFTEVEDGQQFSIGTARITCRRLNHPGFACSYRLECNGSVLTYLCDADLNTELLLGDHMEAPSLEEKRRWLDRLRQSAHDLARGADLLVCDTFFLPEEYKPDWGHSRPDDALRLGLEAGARRLVLFHHDPRRDDGALDAILQRYAPQAAGRIQLLIAAENMEFSL